VPSGWAVRESMMVGVSLNDTDMITWHYSRSVVGHFDQGFFEIAQRKIVRKTAEG